MGKIHEYPLEATVLQDTDFADLDAFNSGTGLFQSKKISGLNLKDSVLTFITPNLDARDTANRNRANHTGTQDVSTITGLAIVATTNDYNDLDNLPIIPVPLTAHSELILDDGTNPHGTTATDVGLGNVDNTSDLNKPISTATQLALDDKQDELISGVNIKTVDGQSILGAGDIPFPVIPAIGVNQSSTQWSKIIPAPVTLVNGNIANGFTFFDNTDKVAGGTTAYDEYDITFGITITLSGTLGSANINVDGVDYLATFDTDLFTTASNWVATNQATLNALGIQVFRLGLGADGRIRFGSSDEALLNAITITPTIIQVANLNGTLSNEFTGSALASPDHVVVPYLGTPYDGQRLHHTFRVNFGIAVGSTQTYGLSLRRFSNDTIIGSEIAIQRNQDVEGVQVTFASYTAGALDPFVTGGFYFALRNNSGQDADIVGGIGILIQNEYQQPTNF